ncbi:hypothetical protein [Pseudomonas synxantha]|uniref:Site-specific recombinase, phage integrase family n=1 Tax=Pseudomonas synxantha TaxID=47883 RepID=A0AAU8TLT9_9PSED|nr:hypothetical protein [Pseudomonas synxantha]AKA82799.1 site-specific recombinase, phage integrase family [Pseudomonas synxantha]
MASYENPAHANRLVVIPRLANAFAELHVTDCPEGGVVASISGSETERNVFQLDEIGATGNTGHVFNFPFIFKENGLPWTEANSYLLSLIENKHSKPRPTDDVRRKASKLLDYLLFCEKSNIDWKDFSGRRPSLRPTYRYYRHLIDSSGRSGAVINQYTGVVYDFYRYVCNKWHKIDISRVDTVKKLKVMLQHVSSYKSIEVEKRALTRRIAPSSPIPIGFVRDGGENLRPLTNSQLSEVLDSIYLPNWTAQERLIVLTSLMTGARKQSVLTLRVRHLESFVEANLRSDGTYLINAGPGTGIDTKFDKEQRLYVPRQLGDDLKLWATSPSAVKRRKVFVDRMLVIENKVMEERDAYLFLSDQGNCYYMAEDDPRYELVKSRPSGQVTETIKRKLLRSGGCFKLCVNGHLAGDC